MMIQTNGTASGGVTSHTVTNGVTGLTLIGYALRVTSQPIAGLALLTLRWTDPNGNPQSWTTPAALLLTALGAGYYQGSVAIDSQGGVYADITIVGLVGTLAYDYRFGLE